MAVELVTDLTDLAGLGGMVDLAVGGELVLVFRVILGLGLRERLRANEKEREEEVQKLTEYCNELESALKELDEKAPDPEPLSLGLLVLSLFY